MLPLLGYIDDLLTRLTSSIGPAADRMALPLPMSLTLAKYCCWCCPTSRAMQAVNAAQQLNNRIICVSSLVYCPIFFSVALACKGRVAPKLRASVLSQQPSRERSGAAAQMLQCTLVAMKALCAAPDHPCDAASTCLPMKGQGPC